MFCSDADLCLVMPGRRSAAGGGEVQGEGVCTTCCDRMSRGRQRRGIRCSRAGEGKHPPRASQSVPGAMCYTLLLSLTHDRGRVGARNHPVRNWMRTWWRCELEKTCAACSLDQDISVPVDMRFRSLSRACCRLISPFRTRLDTPWRRRACVDTSLMRSGEWSSKQGCRSSSCDKGQYAREILPGASSTYLPDKTTASVGKYCSDVKRPPPTMIQGSVVSKRRSSQLKNVFQETEPCW